MDILKERFCHFIFFHTVLDKLKIFLNILKENVWQHYKSNSDNLSDLFLT